MWLLTLYPNLLLLNIKICVFSKIMRSHYTNATNSCQGSFNWINVSKYAFPWNLMTITNDVEIYHYSKSYDLMTIMSSPISCGYQFHQNFSFLFLWSAPVKLIPKVPMSQQLSFGQIWWPKWLLSWNYTVFFQNLLALRLWCHLCLSSQSNNW